MIAYEDDHSTKLIHLLGNSASDLTVQMADCLDHCDMLSRALPYFCGQALRRRKLSAAHRLWWCGNILQRADKQETHSFHTGRPIWRVDACVFGSLVTPPCTMQLGAVCVQFAAITSAGRRASPAAADEKPQSILYCRTCISYNAYIFQYFLVFSIPFWCSAGCNCRNALAEKQK